MLNPNVIIPFDGLHANIPAGFTRDTRFDGKFAKGVASGFGDAGGAATHTHTSPAHSHADVHTHAFNTGDNDSSGGTRSHVGGGTIARNPHFHSGTTGSVTSGSTSNATSTYSEISNNPPYYEVIFIKSSGYNFIPVNGMIMHASTRAGLILHSASNNRFLRGAGTGANSGLTGGSVTNIHEVTHTHTINAHGHNTATVSDGGSLYGGNDSYGTAYWNHKHDVTFGTTTSSITATQPSQTCPETVEPKHCKIRHYIATNPTLPKPGDIAMTTEAINPTGWITCDGEDGTPNMSDYYIKNANVAFDNNSNSGYGSNTHTHAAQAHTHVATGTHNAHTISVGESYGPTGYISNYDYADTCHIPHGHTGSAGNMNAATSVYQNANTTADSSNNEPEYVKVRFIQLKFPVAGGALLAIL